GGHRRSGLPGSGTGGWILAQPLRPYRRLHLPVVGHPHVPGMARRSRTM
ncbi:uncharacterized protein METZ01_LOCUS455947, partial [marine metagenome]